LLLNATAFAPPGTKPDGPDAQHWRYCRFVVEQSRLAYRLSKDSEDLLDDYCFWRERDPVKSPAISAPRNPNN
jgi:hypothetical protein